MREDRSLAWEGRDVGQGWGVETRDGAVGSSECWCGSTWSHSEVLVRQGLEAGWGRDVFQDCFP